LHISLDFVISEVSAVNDEDNTVQLNMYLEMAWEEHRMYFNKDITVRKGRSAVFSL